ncbi:DMT family transporter [Aeromicrobium sp. UC242_57]|uniref:DMT family transporter n=1 Tax=Aeromicrobium sp. UC242_57 TaxID=3374624 RepID=UPI0037B10F99
MSARLTGALLIALSAVAFGSMAIFGVWAHEDGIDTPALIFVRFALASVVLVAVIAGTRHPVAQPSAVSSVAAMGGIGYVGQSYCYFLALEHAQASLVALLLYLFPAFVAVLAAVFLRERIGLVTALALALALIGTALVVGGGIGPPAGLPAGDRRRDHLLGLHHGRLGRHRRSRRHRGVDDRVRLGRGRQRGDRGRAGGDRSSVVLPGLGQRLVETSSRSRCCARPSRSSRSSAGSRCWVRRRRRCSRRWSQS